MKKKIFAALALTCGLSACIFAGCTVSAVGIKSIEKTATDGLVDTYTITYTNGTTSTYTVTNGTNGLDSGVSVKSIEKDYSVDNVDYYKVVYTDADKEPGYFTVTNGKDAEKLTAEEVYAEYKKQLGSDISFDEFCSLYLSVSAQATLSALDNALLSSAKVYTVFDIETTTYDRWGRPTGTTTSKSMYCGSAVIYDMGEEYTYFVTNYHVMYLTSGVSKISQDVHLYLYGSEGTPAKNGDDYVYGSYAINCEYVGGAVEYDLALLKAKTEDVKAINPQAQKVTLAEGYAVGESVFAIGNTENSGIAVTRGVVSVDREEISLNIDGTTRKYRSLRTDTMIYNGNSGGGLFNEQGKLIGINHAGDTDVSFMNNAIPCQTVKSVVDGLMHYASAESSLKGTKRLILGVTVSGANSRFVYNSATGSGVICEDVTVAEIVPGSVAESLSIAAGDVITGVKINGTDYEIKRFFELGDIFLNVRAGDVLVVNYTRGGTAYSTEARTIAAAELTSCT